MGVSICQCGVAAGYPHTADCPRPCFWSGQGPLVQRWYEDRRLLKAVLDAVEYYGRVGEQQQAEAFAGLYRRLKGEFASK